MFKVRQQKMKKRFPVSIYNLCGLLVAAYGIYYMLLGKLPLSIRSVWSGADSLVSHFPALAVGLLPVYLGLIVFGMAALGYYAGSLTERFVVYFFQSQKNKA
jgi:hypothetical protein